MKDNSNYHVKLNLLTLSSFKESSARLIRENILKSRKITNILMWCVMFNHYNNYSDNVALKF